MVESVAEEEREMAAQLAAEFLNEELPELQFGAPKAGMNQWASAIRVLDPIKVSHSACPRVIRKYLNSSLLCLLQGETTDLVELDQNEAAFRYETANM